MYHHSLVLIASILIFIQKGTCTVETCPKTHGPDVIARPLQNTDSVVLLNNGNPITCNGYIKGWRFYAQVADQFLVLVFRSVLETRKFSITSRTIINARTINNVEEYTLSESDWIPVLNGDLIGIHDSNGVLVNDDAAEGTIDSRYFLYHIEADSLLTERRLEFDAVFTWRTYSLQAMLSDLPTPNFRVFSHVLQLDTDQRKSTSGKIYINDWDKFRNAGTITGWRVAVAKEGILNAYVYREVDRDAGTYEVVGKSVITLTADQVNTEVEHVLTYSEQIPFVPGDRIGFASSSKVLYEYIRSRFALGHGMYGKTNPTDVSVDVGDVVTFIEETQRFCSFEAVVVYNEPLGIFQSSVIGKDYKLQNNILESLTTEGQTSCLAKCVSNELCKSVNYNQQAKTCDLNDITKDSDVVNYVSEVGQTYIELQMKTKRSFSQCNMVDCGIGKECEPADTLDGYVCRCISTGFVADYCHLDECTAPLGMESKTILDGQITASSIYASDCSAHCGRLGQQVEQDGCSGSWCSSALTNEWLKVDLLVEHTITGVVTQGRDLEGPSQWVLLYSVSYTKFDQLGETFITDGNGRVKIFSGNWDKTMRHAHYFKQPIQATAIKFNAKGFNDHISMRVEILGCRNGSQWVRAFKAISRNGNSIYDAWNDGTGASSYHAHKFLISNTHYRSNVILDNWSSLGITKVKLTLYSQFNEEVKSIVFNGLGSTTTSWFTLANIEESPWDDLTSGPTNYFGISGHGGDVGRRFFINRNYGGCTVDAGWLLVAEGTACKEYEGYTASNRILYSKTNSHANWSRGHVGTARAMTIDVKLN